MNNYVMFLKKYNSALSN